MKRATGIAWLIDELPALVREGVFGEDTAQRLREHYGPLLPQRRTNWGIVVSSVLGSALIGLGIILVLAVNWEMLGRPLRTVLSLGPMLIGQGICAWVIWARAGSTAWREGASLFLGLTVGAAIALVGQTYHISGDFGTFILTWSLLAVPLVYLMNGTAVAIGYLAGITVWAGDAQSGHEHAMWFWPLAAVAAPYVLLKTCEDRYGPRAMWLLWAVCICLCVATGIVLEKNLPGIWIVVYSSLFSVMYLTGSYWFDDASSTGQRPFQTVGAGGIAVLTLLFSFEWPWREIGWRYYRSGYEYSEAAGILDYVFVAVLFVCAIALLVTSVRRRRSDVIVPAAMPILSTVGYMMAAAWEEYAPIAWAFNLFGLVLGVWTIRTGIARDRLYIVNAGMLMVSALILVRFFDSSMSFVVRGVVFILVGAAFLASNVLLLQRRRKAA